MDKLILEILSQYLPHRLKGIFQFNDEKCVLVSIDYFRNKISVFGKTLWNDLDVSEFKPLLRPLSDLTKEIEHNGERFVPIERISEMLGVDIITDEKHHLIAPITLEPYNVVRQLCEWHIDVFNIIPLGLAVSIERQG